MSCRATRSYTRHGRVAFSLVEVMVVIVIISMLAGMVTLSVRSYLIAGKQGVAKVEVAKICEAIETFESLHNRLPTNQEGLLVLVDGTDRFPEGLLQSSGVPIDPWGNEYQYNHPGRSGPFEVICYGSDGMEGGQGAATDITSESIQRDRTDGR